MCGIAGFVNVRQGAVDPSILNRMTDVMAHRGPDGRGFFHDDFAALGHLRLSIVDLATGGQPMYNEDHNLVVVYNGEIFNHSDLRPELEAAGHTYHSHSDTEAILHSYEQFGRRSVERFRGMFSYAIWDRRAKRLFCARDRLGIKPFYYYWDQSVFVFASEIKGLLEHPSVPARFREETLDEYLAFGYLSDETTMFHGIRKLMPGHTLILDTVSGTLSIERYWNIPERVDEQKSDEEWIAECRQRLETTVRMRLMSDVPLGMFLSGGVDSSAIAALIKRMADGPVKTFSVGYAEEQYSELSYAAQVAKVIGTDHHEVRVSMDDFFGALPKLVWHEDEPIVWPSSVSLHFVSKLAAEEVTVVLTGEGSDELFGGYTRYQHVMLSRQLLKYYGAVSESFRGSVRDWVATSSLLPAGARRKLQHTVLGRTGDHHSIFLDNFYSAFSEAERKSLLRTPATRSAYETYDQYFEERPDAEFLDRLLYADQKTYLVELLMKQDQMSMSCSIESRVPFLDHPFVEFATRVPQRMKIRGKEGKYILKKAVEDLLPHDIIYRTKMGFPTPLRSWLASPEAAPLNSRLLTRDGFIASYLDVKLVERLIEKQVSGIEDCTDRLWRLLNLQLWGEMFFGAKKQTPEELGSSLLPAKV